MTFSEGTQKRFQSTRPVRGGTNPLVQQIGKNLFQSTRPVRGGTPARRVRRTAYCISIHPPRAGRDTDAFSNAAMVIFQSTRPVRGGTMVPPPKIGVLLQFQSTRPVRGGTAHTMSCLNQQRSNFNPPAPCGAGLLSSRKRLRSTYFNPPAPCGAGPA